MKRPRLLDLYCGQGGTMFGLPLYRHRLFETSFLWLAPGHPKHPTAPRRRGAPDVASDIVFVNQPKHSDRHIRTPKLNAWSQPDGSQGMGHSKGYRIAAKSMGVEWMDREGTTQAVPPVFTEFIGHHFYAEVLRRSAA